MSPDDFFRYFGGPAIAGVVVAVCNFWFTRWHDERRAVAQLQLERQKIRDALNAELLRKSIDAHARIFAVLYDFEDALFNTDNLLRSSGAPVDQGELRRAAGKFRALVEQFFHDRFFFSDGFSSAVNAYNTRATALIDELSRHCELSQAEKDSLQEARTRLIELSPQASGLIASAALGSPPRNTHSP